MTNNIIPAILEDDFENIENKVEMIKEHCGRVELDVCDGKFVPVKNWPFSQWEVFETIKDQKEGLPFWQKIDYSAHLMVEEPELIISDLISAGFSRIFIHLENGSDKCQALIDEWGRSVDIGLAISLETNLDKVSGFLDQVKFIQLMARGHLGEQGYDLDERIFEKVSKLKEMGFEGEISVDGGVTLDNFEDLIGAGADSLVVGSEIWNDDNPLEILQTLQNSL